MNPDRVRQALDDAARDLLASGERLALVEARVDTHRARMRALLHEGTPEALARFRENVACAARDRARPDATRLELVLERQ